GIRRPETVLRGRRTIDRATEAMRTRLPCGLHESPTVRNASVEHRGGMPCERCRVRWRMSLTDWRAERDVDARRWKDLEGAVDRGPEGGDLQRSTWDVPAWRSAVRHRRWGQTTATQNRNQRSRSVQFSDN